IQFADYAAWQREQFESESLAGDIAYWKQQLGDAPAALDLPTDRPRPAVQSYRGAARVFNLAQDTSTKLRELAQQQGTTLYMALLAAFQTLLSRYTGKEDIVVGSPVAGRNYAETEDLIGFFVNTVVLRSNLSGNPGFADLLARVRETAVSAFAHQ